MFPGYIYIYKDADKFIHLYFYQGIDEDGTDIYSTLKINEEYTQLINKDKSIDYKFKDKHIIQFNCKLVSKHKTENIVLKLK